jgi:hypothetical protein
MPFVLSLHTPLMDKTKGLHEGPSYSKKGWAYDFQRLRHIIISLFPLCLFTTIP